MTQVRIHTQLAGENFASQWQCGPRSGVVITPPVVCSHPRLAAELLALCYLVVTKSVVGLDKGLHPVDFQVSVPELPTAISHSAGFGSDIRLRSRALRARFADASFQSGAVQPGLLPGADEVALADTDPIDWRLTIRTHRDVVLTEHAVQRVQERHNFSNLGYAFRLLRRWTKHDLQEIVLPPAAIAHKLAKYGDQAAIVADEAGWHGVIVNNTLVTMFLRKP